MADNLESYFKKHLSKDSQTSDNWNVPSDDVWDKVLPEITKKKGLFIPWRYLYILAILVLAGLAYFLWPSDKFDRSLNTDTPEFVRDENHPKAYQNTDNITIVATKNASNEKTESENSSVPANIPMDNLYSPTNETSHIEESNVEHSNTATGIRSSQNSNRNLPVQNISSDAFLIESRETTEIASLYPKSIAFPPFPIQIALLKDNYIPSPLPADPEKKKPEPFNNKDKFGIGLFFAPTFTSTHLKGEMSSGLIETSNMFLYSNNWGFEVRYHISNKFVLVSGVEKSEIRSWSKSLVDFGYDTSTEHEMSTGEKENMSPVPMPTPFGEINTEITYRFPGNQNIPDGEIMNSILETHQDVRYLSIPFGVEYNMLRFSHFNWFAEGGIRYNRALQDGTSFTSRILHEGHDMDVVGESMTTYPSYSLNYLNYYLGTGINYQFSKSFQVNGSARYFSNITKVNIQDNLATNVQGLNFKIGLVYIF